MFIQYQLLYIFNYYILPLKALSSILFSSKDIDSIKLNNSDTLFSLSSTDSNMRTISFCYSIGSRGKIILDAFSPNISLKVVPDAILSKYFLEDFK